MQGVDVNVLTSSGQRMGSHIPRVLNERGGIPQPEPRKKDTSNDSALKRSGLQQPNLTVKQEVWISLPLPLTHKKISEVEWSRYI